MTAPTYPTVGSSPWDASLKTYVDGMAGAGATLLGWSNGSNDTTTINALLSAGGYFRGIPGETYRVTMLTVPTGATLDMTGCTVQQIASTNTDMLQVSSQTSARTLMDGVATAASTNFTSATAAFVSGDVGKTIWIYGAGTTGDIHKTTIASVTNGTTVVLTAAPPLSLAVASFSVGTRTSGVTIVGGTWDKQSNNLYVMRFRRSDKASVRNLKVISNVVAGGLKYGVNFGDCTDFTAENLEYDYSSDGVHVNGPVVGGVIRNIRGYTRDDLVSLTPNDWSPNNDVYGDIVDVKVTDIDLNMGANCAVKVLGGSSSPLTTARGIRVRNVSGSTTKTSQTFGGLAMIGDDTGNANTIGGFCDDISIEGVSGHVPDNSNLVVVGGSNVGTVLIDGVGWDSTTNTSGPVAIGGGTGTIQHAIVRNVRINRLKVGANAVIAQANVTTKRLTIENVTVKDWQTTTSSSVLIPVGGPGGVEKVEIRNVRVIASTGGIVCGFGANIASVLMDQIEVNNTSNSAFILSTNAASAVCTDATISRVIGTSGWTAGYIAQASSATAGFTRLTICESHCTGVGGSPVIANTSGQILGTLIVADSTFVGTSWGIGDIATASDIILDGVQVASAANGLINLRAAASVKVRGEGNLLAGIVNLAAGGVWTSYSSDPAFTATAGGLPTIAAGAGAGTGPTVSIVGNDRMGTVTVTTGTTPAAGVLATITFTRTFGSAPRSVQLTPTAAAGAAINPYTTKSATTFVVNAQTAPAASTAHTFDYLVTG